jgi:chitinase
LDGSASRDPNGSIIFYRWNFGDGSSEILDKAPEHTYADPGTYTVILTVVDNSGRSAIANTTATVSGSIPENSPPVAMSGGPYSGEAGKPVLFNGSASYDQDGSLVSYSWNFGDGSLGSGIAPSHQYIKANTYFVTLTVTDNDGVTNQISTAVTITSVSTGILGVNPLFIGGIAVLLIIVAVIVFLFFRRRRQGEETEEEEQTEQ